MLIKGNSSRKGMKLFKEMPLEAQKSHLAYHLCRTRNKAKTIGRDSLRLLRRKPHE